MSSVYDVSPYNSPKADGDEVVIVDQTVNRQYFFHAAEPSQPKRSPATCFISIPLTAVLGLQCFLVILVFTALVVMTSLMMDSATRDLVEQSIASDLQYTRARILAPIQSYEHTAVTLRQAYLYQSKAVGKDICADSNLFMDSQAFFIQGSIATRQSSRISYVYSLRRSETRMHLPEGLPDVVECDVTPENIALINSASRLTDRAAEFDEMSDLDSIPFSLDPTDYFYESYVTDALSYARLGWQPYLYVDPVYNTSDLYLAGYFPVRVNRTYVNGTQDSYEPDLYVREPPGEDVADAVAVSMIGLDVGMTQFADLMKSVTPDTDGAHTSVYDLANGVLVCSSEGIQLYNDVFEMWPAGATSSSTLNAAYADFNSMGVEAPVDAVAYSSIEDAAETAADVHVRYTDNRVVSAVIVTTTSGINFVVVQSTPESHYLGPVTKLRNIMIIVGVVAAVAVVVVCLLIGLAIRSPLREIDRNMQLAAVMKNDRVVTTTSFLTEINELCGAFDRMNAKLLQARAFMPQSMLIDTTEGEEDEDDDDAQSTDPKGHRHTSLYQSEEDDGSSHKPSITTDRSQTASVADTASRRAYARVQSRKGNATVTGATFGASAMAAIVQKRVSILAINAKGFHGAVNVSVPTSVSAPAAELTALVHSVCTSSRGVIDSFHGDHFVLSFNAVKNNAQGPQCAARAAFGIISASGQTRSYQMGISTGRACVGHLGTAALKRLSIVGRAYSRALALEGVCRRFNEINRSAFASPSFVECVVDRALAVEICDTHTLQVIGRVIGGSFSSGLKHTESEGQPLPSDQNVSSLFDADMLYALRGSDRDATGGKQMANLGSGVTKSSANDEWLYEVQQHAGLDPILGATNNALSDFIRSTREGDNDPGSDSGRSHQIRQELHNVLNRIAEMPSPATSEGSPITWGRVALEYARLVANGKSVEFVS